MNGGLVLIGASEPEEGAFDIGLNFFRAEVEAGEIGRRGPGLPAFGE